MNQAHASLYAIEESPLVRKRKVGRPVKGGANERPIQREIVKSLRKLGLRVAAVPNGVAYRGNELQRMRQAAALKADGLVPGFPDLIAFRPISRGGPDCALLEVKKPGGYLDPDQIDFEERCWRDGIKHAVVTSLDEALAALGKWGWL